MLEEKVFLNIDPSRRTTYQMLEYAGKKVIAQKTGDLLLLKTESFIDIRYNQAHSLNKNFSISDLETIKTFFGDEPFRLKLSGSESDDHILLANGFELKNRGFAMEIDSLDSFQDEFILPDNVKIKAVESEGDLNIFKTIFAAAFDYQVADCERKFGFLEEFILNPEDKKIKFFLLYKNGQAVSSGGYFAFDNFSVENIGTIVSARGKGYAGLMVKFLLQEATKLGYSSACLTASLKGAAVYEKVGFKILSNTKTYILCAE